MAYPILGTPKPAFFDSSGSPLASGTITTQDPTDDSVKASYPTAADADAGTNGTSGDITLDSRGEPTSTQYWGRDNEDYKVIIKDVDGNTVYTLTNIRLPSHNRRAAVTFSSGDATPSIAESNVFITAGSTTITDFDDGQVGDIIQIRAGADITIQTGGPIYCSGISNFNMNGGDTVTFAMFTDQVWYEIGRSYTGRANTESVTSFTNTITAGESGKTFFLNLAGGGSSLLPSPAAGLNYTFIVGTQPTTAYTIDTTSGDNIMYGTTLDIVGELVYGSARDIISFVASTSVVGDRVDVVSDGTNWYYKAFSGADGGITTGAT